MNVTVRIAASLLLLAPVAAQSAVCSNEPPPPPLPVRSTPVPPIVSGLAGAPIPFVSPHALLAESRDEALALDVVLLRLRMEGCTKDQFANYKPRTQFDNTPWRYNMEKGKKFNAAEFDAWMKSRGVRVARGTTPASAPTTVPAASAEPTAADASSAPAAVKE